MSKKAGPKTHEKLELPTVYVDSYTDDDKALVVEIISWVNEWANDATGTGFENRRSQSRLAVAAGLKAPTVNIILNGKYSASPSKFLHKLIDTIHRQNDREAQNIGENPFVETSVYVAVRAACKRAHTYRSFSVVSAFVGTGKTRALKQYAKDHPNCILIEATPSMDSKILLRELVEKCGAIVHKTYSYSQGTKNDMMDAVISKLTGTDKLIILDEADKVNPNTLEYVRRISDKAKVGVVLSGTEELHPMLRDPRGRFGQISSRVLFWPPVIRSIKEHDAKAIVEAAIGHEADLTPEIHQAFYEMCDGSARVLAHSLVTGVRDYGLRKGNELTVNMVYQVATKLLGLDRPKKRRAI